MVDTYGRWYPDYPGQQMFQDPAYWRAIGQPIPQNTAQGTQSGKTIGAILDELIEKNL